jgi:hypothetical protein
MSERDTQSYQRCSKCNKKVWTLPDEVGGHACECGGMPTGEVKQVLTASGQRALGDSDYRVYTI